MIELMRTRRSIRQYQKKAVTAEHLEVLKEALLRCPSSRGFNPWTFVFVDEPALLAKLSCAKEHGSGFLRDAALGIVVCGDETKSDVWVEDCAIASVVAHLTAHSLGMGSCWIQIRKREHSKEESAEAYVRGLLGIPGHLRVLSIISIGYPAESKRPVAWERLEFGKIKVNGYL
ncbi:MAG TPA: nitroreductase family protein [Dissulfurispiraceae bacterium]|nr:nitroreductase family protein [Dissulfurispiraceae bacterium]